MLQLEAGQVLDAIRRLSRSSRSRTAAIAYVSSDKWLKFGKGDVLVTDASNRSIAQGLTSAKVLAKAVARGAQVFSLSGLHAKLLALESCVVCGSANLSQSAGEKLFEAVVVSDDSSLRSAVLATVEHLMRRARCVDDRFLDRILTIPVVRKGSSSGASRNERASKISPAEALKAGGRVLDGLSFLFWHVGSDLTDQKAVRIAHKHGLVLPLDWKKNGDWLDFTHAPRRTKAWFRKYESDPRARTRSIVFIEVSVAKKGNALQDVIHVERRLYRHFAAVNDGDRLVQYLIRTRDPRVRIDSSAARELERLLKNRLSSTARLQRLNRHPTLLLSPREMRTLLGY